ncbi:uncharacterized protein LOC143465988 [Clavelina lepadiformis]|uniref:Uncharacterized protein n=1 Tax=Clavelina lepadiformis TaxID=159417 RepID=A0ABP0GSB8_CLALP
MIITGSFLRCLFFHINRLFYSKMDKIILKVLPNLPQEMLLQLENTLESLGVENKKDLIYVSEKDILPVLKPVQARKLITSWKQDDDHDYSDSSKLDVSNVSDTSEVSSSSTTDSLDWIYRFDIPWNDFPQGLLQSCENFRVPDPLLRLEMVRVLVDAIFMKTKRPVRRELSTIAYQIVSKYPQSFKDEVDGITIGTGHESLTSQLSDRVSYCHRKRKRFAGITQPVLQNHMPSTSAMITPAKQCDQRMECEETLNAHRLWLCQEYKKDTSHQDKSKIANLMQTTYRLQRNVILEKKSISQIKEEWPFLLHEEHLLNHYNTLMEGEAIDSHELLDAITNRASFIYKALKNEKGRFKEEVINLKQEARRFNNKSAYAIYFLHLLTCFFKEEKQSIYEVFAEDASMETTLSRVPVTPFISTFGSSLMTGRTYVVSIERQVLFQSDSFFRSFLYLYSSYFVFDMEYPQKAKFTLEFVQRYFAKNNGPISRKRQKHEVPSRILKLCKMISRACSDH